MADVATVEAVLHRVTDEGGLGFCHAAVPAILPAGYHGPLVVALDSSILIDLQEHGRALVDGEAPYGDAEYQEELGALGLLIDMWLLRDIRFIATPRSRTDAKRMTERFIATRGPAIDALAESLAFQYGDRTVAVPSDFEDLFPRGEIRGLPDSADRDLVAEAQSVGAHVFLTRDHAILDKAVVTGAGLAIMAPTSLAGALTHAGIDIFRGGLCEGHGCPFSTFDVPGPDMGKWSGLFSLFEAD
jgi:hypothetical protein